MVSDDEDNQAATKDAFEVLGFIAGNRLDVTQLLLQPRHQFHEFRVG